MQPSEKHFLQFIPFSSAIETGFWHTFSQLKLDVLCLNDEPVPINGSYSNNTAADLPSLFNIDLEAFSSQEDKGSTHGLLINKNTAEEFKSCDKSHLLQLQGNTIWDNILNGRALENPSLLDSFVLLTFADLKKYDFLYWFGFPALKLPESICLQSPIQKLSECLTSKELESLAHAFDSSPVARPDGPRFFLVQLDGAYRVLPLSHLGMAPPGPDTLLGFCDPSSDPLHPGWPLRNLLALYWHLWGRQCPHVRVLCWRDATRRGVRSVGHSLMLDLQMSHTDGSSSVSPSVAGWERNERGRPGPRLVNLSASMDRTQLSQSAVDLNLKLMRWRMAPDLNIGLLSRSRCLLIGAGTLGCNVARALLGWGVRTITFVDNGQVSFSNPVRQSLFTFQDAVGRRHKAEAAAARLKEIHPGVTSEGHVLSVPMPGHPVSAALLATVTSHIQQLGQLIQQSDVIFLLMDSRESRWLPTLMSAAYGKMVINAALGFDSYLVMRHGCRPIGDVTTTGSVASQTTVAGGDVTTTGGVTSQSTAASCDVIGIGSNQLIPGDKLGCYFCNDVVAPRNSLSDRTLDQQCTVTRPGVSMIAAGLAVELAVSLLQHPLRGGASVSCGGGRGSADPVESRLGPLGPVPHSIRGFLSTGYQQICPATPAFNRCTACSPTVLERYLSDGDEFLMRVFNESSYLEDVTGLSELHKLAEDIQLWELDDDDDDCDGGV